MERVGIVDAGAGADQRQPELHHLLQQLRGVTDVLVKHKNDFVSVLGTLRNFTASFCEAVGSGPYFKAMIVNLVPYQILQPLVDAAFKKRGIDPENFWRSAGLPAFRYPDPNGNRFPNGAPPPAPAVLEGTPDLPGLQWLPVRRVRMRRRRRYRQQGIRCRALALTRDQGPAAPTVRTRLARTLRRPPESERHAAFAGHARRRTARCSPPNAPGTPVPLPNAPPGARREGFVPAGPPPPPSTYAPAPPPGPAAPRSWPPATGAIHHTRRGRGTVADVDDFQHPKLEAAERVGPRWLSVRSS